MKTFRQILAKTALPYGRFFALYLFLAIATAVFDVLVTRATGELSNAATALDTGALTGILLTTAWLTVFKVFCSAVNTYLSGSMRGHAETNLRGRFAHHFAHISFQDLAVRQGGDVLSLYANDLTKSASLLTGELLAVLSSALMLAVSAVFMLRIHWLFTLIFFLSFPLLTVMQVAISKPIAPLAARSSERRGAFNGVVNDCLQNTSLILGYGLEDAMEQRYLNAYQAYFEAEKKRVSVLSRLVIAGIGASFLPLVFLCIAGALAVVGNVIGLGEFLVLFILGMGCNEGLIMLSQNMARIREQQASADRVLDAMAQPHEVPAAPTALRDARVGDALELEGVGFSYDGETPVLKDVSLRIPRGLRVAFVGPSGCGKSTLAKLMLGLYAPADGRVRWLGNDELQMQDARRAVAYVPQDSFLFAGSVADNLRCGITPEGDDTSRLWDALDAAELGDFVRTRSGGLDGLIEEGGENLSGGQRQRLAIARALYREAPILLLDEATSALDPSTEQAVLARFRESAQRQTLIMVAHRLAAVAMCDEIYVMEHGEIAEQGSYEELMQPGTRFYELYTRQQEEGEYEE